MAGNRAGNSVLEEKLTEESLRVSLKGVFKQASELNIKIRAVGGVSITSADPLPDRRPLNPGYDFFIFIIKGITNHKVLSSFSPQILPGGVLSLRSA